MTESHRRHAKIFFPDDWLGVAPAILNLARSLTNRGYATAIYAAELNPNYPTPDLPLEVRVVQISNGYAHKAFLAATDSPLSAFNVGVDCLGALAARRRHLSYGEPYIFWSLELPPTVSDDLESLGAFSAELDAYRHAAAVVIQDENRARALEEYFGHRHGTQFLVPNGPPDAPFPLRASTTDNYFRRRFGLNPTRHPYLVAQTGMIMREVFAEELAVATRGVPHFTFIFHERRRRSPDDPELAAIAALNSTNLFLSLDPVPYHQLSDIYSSIDIGVAYYRPMDVNFTEMAYASGKLGFYLRHGVPVIVNNLPSFVDLIHKYDCGIVVADPSSSVELAHALDRIIASYDRYSGNARQCFLAKFDFNHSTRSLLKFAGMLDK